MGKLVPMGVNSIVNGVEAIGLVKDVLQTIQNVYEIREFEQTRRVAIRAELEYKIAQIESNTQIIIKQLELDHEFRMKILDNINSICLNPNPTEIHVKLVESLIPLINSSRNKQLEGVY